MFRLGTDPLHSQFKNEVFGSATVVGRPGQVVTSPEKTHIALTRNTMLLFRKPSPATIRDFLVAQAKLDLTYTAVGATAAVPPPC